MSWSTPGHTVTGRLRAKWGGDGHSCLTGGQLTQKPRELPQELYNKSRIMSHNAGQENNMYDFKTTRPNETLILMEIHARFIYYRLICELPVIPYAEDQRVSLNSNQYLKTIKSLMVPLSAQSSSFTSLCFPRPIRSPKEISPALRCIPLTKSPLSPPFRARA